MELLKNTQLTIISGGSHGVLHEDGIDHKLDCPLISQSCLDGYLECFKIESEYEIMFNHCMDKLEEQCEGLYGVFNMYKCLDVHGL